MFGAAWKVDNFPKKSAKNNVKWGVTLCKGIYMDSSVVAVRRCYWYQCICCVRGEGQPTDVHKRKYDKFKNWFWPLVLVLDYREFL